VPPPPPPGHNAPGGLPTCVWSRYVYLALATPRPPLAPGLEGAAAEAGLLEQKKWSGSLLKWHPLVRSCGGMLHAHGGGRTAGGAHGGARVQGTASPFPFAAPSSACHACMGLPKKESRCSDYWLQRPQRPFQLSRLCVTRLPARACRLRMPHRWRPRPAPVAWCA